MKKKTSKFLAFLTLSMFLASCSLFKADEQSEPSDSENTSEEVESEEEEEVESNDVNQELSAWIPRLENVVYSYEGVNNEFAELIIIPQFNKDNYYQFITNNGGTTVAEIYEYHEEEIIRTFSRPETYFRDNFSEIGVPDEFKEQEIILKQPIEVGNKWSNDEADYEITAINTDVTVPAGTYSTIEVTAEHESSIIKRYYAEDIGLIHEVSETEDMTIESKLENIKEDIAEEIHLNVFISDEQAEGLVRYDTTLVLRTNDPARVSIQELLTGENTNFEDAKILPTDTKINHLFIDENNIIEVDVSKEFVENMNAGSTGELFTIYGLVNTLSEYYGSQEVLLTVDDKPYEGAHMLLEEGETLTFDEGILSE